MQLSKDQVESLRRLDEGEHAPWYPGPVVIKKEEPQYKESKYVSYHSMILRDYNASFYRLYFTLTKEDVPELMEDSIMIEQVRERSVTIVSYEEV